MPIFEPEVFGAVTKRLGMDAATDLGSLMKNVMWSARSVLNGWGESAKKLVGVMDESDHAAGLRAGADFAKVQGLTRGLNSAEKTHVFDVLDGRAMPASPKFEDISGQIRGVMDSYADDAVDLDLDVYAGSKYRKALSDAMAGRVSGIPDKDGKIWNVQAGDYHSSTQYAMAQSRAPFVARPDYMPHYFNEAAIQSYLKEGPKKEAILNQLMSRGWADNRQSAEVVMREMLERPAEFRGGPLQHAREGLFNVGYERDIDAVLQRYFTTSAKRLEQARRFGSRDEGAYQLINAIGEEGGPGVGERAKGAAQIYSAWAGTKDPYLSSLSRFLTPIHSVTLLSTAGIIQPAQLMNTVARIGWVNTVKGIAALSKDWINHEGGHEAWAVSTGAALDSVRADLQVNSLQDLSQLWMKWIGMEKLDRMNRIVSAVGGRFYAQDLAKNMMKTGGADAGQFRRLFSRMGMNADEIFQRGGQLTDEELRSAGLHVSRDTQFASSVLDLPPFRATPAGRFMYLFKSFALQQTYFIKRELMDEAFKHGNPAPFMAYGSALAGVAPLMGELVRGLKGRRDKTPADTAMGRLKNYGEDLATVGALGAFWDTSRAVLSGPDAVGRYLLGPTAGEAFQFAGADVPAILKRGDFMPLFKHIVHRTPMIGGPLYNAWWPQ